MVGATSSEGFQLRMCILCCKYVANADDVVAVINREKKTKVGPHCLTESFQVRRIFRAALSKVAYRFHRGTPTSTARGTPAQGRSGPGRAAGQARRDGGGDEMIMFPGRHGDALQRQLDGTSPKKTHHHQIGRAFWHKETTRVTERTCPGLDEVDIAPFPNCVTPFPAGGR